MKVRQACPNFFSVVFLTQSGANPVAKLLLHGNIKTVLRSETRANLANSGCFPPDNLSWSLATSGLNQKPELQKKRTAKIGSNGMHSMHHTSHCDS